ncbi:MAG: lysine 2,3-aminomutase [Actinomycetia bacterium]|nr:lysine 2,3-aminomutase [Actinomycetes bacterium]
MRDYKEIKRWENITMEQWRDWKWQMQNRIKSVDQLMDIVELTHEEIEGINASLKKFRMAITPYYAMLMDPHNPECPVRKQAIPSPLELIPSPTDMIDPLAEDRDSPVPRITHRYPDRVLFLITDVCGSYCRHCTRRRYAGKTDKVATDREMDVAMDYISNTPAVRDVLLSGGDPLTISDERLEEVLIKLRKIDHVEIIRIGSRLPCTLPYRITDELCNMLRKYNPIYLNTHFNHPKEFTDDSIYALSKLVDSGIPVGNQTVLLRGVNDNISIMKNLCLDLMQARVRPYYIYQCDLSEGIEHFRTKVDKGIEIMEALRGHISGLAIPTYVIDAPGGGGKISISPQYLISEGDGKVVLRNYQGTISIYREPEKLVGKEAPYYESKRIFAPDQGPTKLMTSKGVSIWPGRITYYRKKDEEVKPKWLKSEEEEI